MERLLKWTIKCFLTALSFTFVCGCDFDIVGRKTLLWSPCQSIQDSKELGFYVYEGRGLGRTKSIIKLGAFAEGGIILSPTTNINEPLIEFTTPFDYSEWATCNVLSSSSAKDHVIGSLNAGLKLTIMFTQGSTRYNNGYRRDVGCAECNEEKPKRRKHKCVMCEEEKNRRKKHKCVMCDYE
jgi:hypothetical protein